MFSLYHKNYNELYNKLVELSRNIFFYKDLLLKDNFETRINLIFIHFSIILIIFKKRKKIKFPQKIYDNIFQNIEYHVRELGYGDVAVNKKMKTLNKIFYNILLKIEEKNQKKFLVNVDVILDHLSNSAGRNNEYIEKLTDYIEKFYNFCFELSDESMLEGQINFKI